MYFLRHDYPLNPSKSKSCGVSLDLELYEPKISIWGEKAEVVLDYAQWTELLSKKKQALEYFQDFSATKFSLDNARSKLEVRGKMGSVAMLLLHQTNKTSGEVRYVFLGEKSVVKLFELEMVVTTYCQQLLGAMQELRDFVPRARAHLKHGANYKELAHSSRINFELLLCEMKCFPEN